MLKELNEKTMAVAGARIKLANAKNELTKTQSQIQVMDKDYWKELGITNAEGRKAHIALGTEELSDAVLTASNNLIMLEAELECLERLFEYGGEADE